MSVSAALDSRPTETAIPACSPPTLCRETVTTFTLSTIERGFSIALPNIITFLLLVLLFLVILILGVIAAPSAHCCLRTGLAPVFESRPGLTDRGGVVLDAIRDPGYGIYRC